MFRRGRTSVRGADPVYGPASSPGGYYTDKATITAVQKKLASIGYFNGVIDGKFGSVTEAALFNFSGQHGPPDGPVLIKLFSGQNGPADPALLSRLGLSAPMTFEPDVVTLPKNSPEISPAAKAMLAAADKQADQATTPAQVQAAANQAAAAVQSPAIKAAQQAASQALFPWQVEAAKVQLQSAIAQHTSFWNRPVIAGIPAWGIAAGSIGVFAVFGLAWAAFRPRSVSSRGH